MSPSQFDYASLPQDANGLCGQIEDKLTVPSFDKFREEVFESIHVHPFSGHWGLSTSLQTAKQLRFWHGMAADVKRWYHECDSSQ